MNEQIPQATFCTQVVNHGILGHYVATAADSALCPDLWWYAEVVLSGANNVFNPAQISAVAQRILNMYPNPNTGGGLITNNYNVTSAEAIGVCLHSMRATAVANALSNEADILRAHRWLGQPSHLRPAWSTARGQSNRSRSALAWPDLGILFCALRKIVPNMPSFLPSSTSIWR
jgi:hypothetical protein